jgi:predicted nucleic acid-binding protein
MILVDTSPLVGAAISNDGSHQICRELFERLHAERQALLASPFVVHEACYMLNRDGSATIVQQFLASVASGLFEYVDLEPEDLARIGRLLVQYEDIRLDPADASLIAIAERMGIDTIATLDYRDFRTVRPSHIEYFTLLPDQSSS